MKRFYKQATAGSLEDQYTVLLDGRAIKTPAKHPFKVVTEALAQEIAQEWQSQEAEVKPETMPLMQLASTAIDRVRPQFEDIAVLLSDYAGNELLCYRADKTQAEFRKQQDEKWQPLLEWAEETHGLVLEITTGIMPISQKPTSLERARARTSAMSVEELTVFSQFVQNTGSYVLGLALLEERLSVTEAHHLAELEELWNQELWGADVEAVARREYKLAELEAAHKFKQLL